MRARRTEIDVSYDIYIGNAVPRYPSEDYGLFGWRVEGVEHPDAPVWPTGPGVWPDISGKTNGRHPGYTQMADWARTVGLYELWLGERDGLLHPHPGIHVLTPEIRDEVRAARVAWERGHPRARPGWGDDQDSCLARLLWYEWWMNWALENCPHPAVANF